jgi:hypothetical protein
MVHLIIETLGAHADFQSDLQAVYLSVVVGGLVDGINEARRGYCCPTLGQL